MDMRALLVSVSVVGVLLVAGCSSSEQQPDRPTSVKPTTVAAKVAPMSAFTQVVAEYKPKLEQASALSQSACSAASEASGCQTAYDQFGDIAAELHGDLLAPHAAGTTTYQGAPPKEIAALLADTETLASRASRMTSEYKAADCPDVVLDCTKERTWAQLSVGELVQKLAEWDAHM
jgi:outer membrane murein-binding lipoprotein Lpp